MCNDCINVFEYAFMFWVFLFISAEFRTQLLTENIILRYSMYNEKIESVAVRPIEWSWKAFIQEY